MRVWQHVCTVACVDTYQTNESHKLTIGLARHTVSVAGVHIKGVVVYKLDGHTSWQECTYINASQAKLES